jgi:hypothetical protein
MRAREVLHARPITNRLGAHHRPSARRLRAVSHTQVAAPQHRNSILLFPVSRHELGDHARVLARVKDYLRSDPAYRAQPHADVVVVFTDESGQAILPEIEAESRAPETATAKAENALSFTFDSPQNPWTPEELTLLSDALSDFYPVATRIYGPPAFNITVNVRKDPTSPAGGLYFVSSNEMVLPSASVLTLDVVCHEMFHAFRDDDIIGLASFEEGMARAAEVEVFDEVPGYVHWDEAHSYDLDIFYDALNRPEIGSTGGNFFDGSISVLVKYQLAGYAWGKALIENDRFLERFNHAYYRQLKRDPSTRSMEAALLKIAATAQKSVEGERFEAWYSHQYVLNTAPPTGLALYHYINTFDTVDFFDRDTTGIVSVIPNAPVEWRATDHNGDLLDAGTGVTVTNGFLNFHPAVPAGYSGRVEIIASATTPTGHTIETTAFLPFSSADGGLFGVVLSDNEGMVEIKSLDDPHVDATVPVVNGVFTAPALETVRGRFVGRFFTGGELKRERVFTKDASFYFISF